MALPFCAGIAPDPDLRTTPSMETSARISTRISMALAHIPGSGHVVMYCAIIRLVGAIMLETNNEWMVARRYMSLQSLARERQSQGQAARRGVLIRTLAFRWSALLHHATGHYPAAMVPQDQACEGRVGLVW